METPLTDEFINKLKADMGKVMNQSFKDTTDRDQGLSVNKQLESLIGSLNVDTKTPAKTVII